MPSRPDPVPTRLRRRRVALVVAGLALVVGACGAQAPSEPDLSKSLVDSGVSKQVADCTAKALTTSLSDSELQRLVERGAGGAPVDETTVTDDSADKLSKAMTKCKDLALELETTATIATSDEETVPSEGPSATALSPDGAQFDTTTTTAP